MRKPFFWASRGGWYIKIKADNGKWRNLRIGETESDAIDCWHQMRDRAKRAGEPDGMTVGEVCGIYFDAIREQVSIGQMAASTLVQRRDYLVSFLAYKAVADVVVRDFRPFHVDEWLSAQSTWNATTRHHGAAAIKRVMKWAADKGRITASPIASLVVAAAEARTHLIDQPLYDLLMEGASDPRCNRKRVRSFRVVLIALRLSGCRPGEVAAVRIEDIQDGCWVIKDHKTRRKTQKPRIVYPCPCLETLAKISAGNRKSGPLFRPDVGDGWSYSKMRRRFERLKKRVNADADCILYSFRRTSITDSLRAGVSAAETAELHGTSIRMIEKHYGHLCQHKGHMRQAARKAVLHRRTP